MVRTPLNLVHCPAIWQASDSECSSAPNDQTAAILMRARDRKLIMNQCDSGTYRRNLSQYQ
jgi:hypothetical protein